MARPTPTVLVVDDEPDIRETLRDILEAEGYRVECASNGVEALAALEHAPRPKLILLDLMMPVMSGYDMLEALKKDPRLSNIPVTIVSAVADATKVKTGEQLPKPIDLDRLLELVAARCRPAST